MLLPVSVHKRDHAETRNTSRSSTADSQVTQAVQLVQIDRDDTTLE